jgi:hypothetical protein
MKTKQHLGSLVAATLLSGSVAIAQQPTDPYLAVMTTLVAQMDTTESVSGNIQAANAFGRVADAEKTKWLPYYYSGLCTVLASFDEKDLTKVDALCLKASQLLDESDRISPNNSEIYCVKAMVALARIKVNMMARGLEGITVAQTQLEKAIELDEKNPRAYFLLGQQAFNTPERLGGSKKVALTYFEKAISLAEEQRNRAKTIEVNWSRKSAERMADMCRKLLASK